MICFHCGAEYRNVWKNGKIQPLNLSDNLAHWATCEARGPNRLRTRAARKHRKNRNVASVSQPVAHRSAPSIRGEHYRPSCGQCSVPPWEVCACTALLADANAMRTHTEGIADLFNDAADERLALVLEKAA